MSNTTIQLDKQELDKQEFNQRYGARVVDEFAGFITDNFGQISLALFVRTPPESPFQMQSALPMVVNKRGELFAVTNCSKVKGFFKKKVQLTLKDKSGDETLINIPLDQFVEDFADSVATYLAFAHCASPIISVMPIMDFMFIKDANLKKCLSEMQ